MSENQQFILLLVSIMIFVHLIKEKGLLAGCVSSIMNLCAKNKFFFPFAVMILGCLPIPGRVVLVSGILDGILNKEDRRENFGVLSYIATHHYYLWSPIEPAVIITIAGMGITYGYYMSVMWPILAVSVVVSIALIAHLMRGCEIDYSKYVVEDAKIDWPNVMPILLLVIAVIIGVPISYAFAAASAFYIIKLKVTPKELVPAIDIKLIVLLVAIMFAGSFIKSYLDIKLLGAWATEGLTLALVASFVLSFVLGSSGKYAAIVVLMLKIFGLKYLPLFYVVDYCGYLIAPTHKCVPIGVRYFKTPYTKFMAYIGILMIALTLAATAITFS